MKIVQQQQQKQRKEWVTHFPLLPFTYAFCMVVSSIVLMTMMVAVSGDGGGFSTDLCLI